MAIPVELFRFRIVRDIQAQKVGEQNAIDLSSHTSVPMSPGKRRKGAASALSKFDPETADHWLGRFSTRLALRSGRMTPDEVRKGLPPDWEQEVASDAWSALRSRLAGSLAEALEGAASHRHPELTSAVEALQRLLRLHALVERLHSDAQQPEPERRLRSASDVEEASTSSFVIMPKSYFSLCPNKPRFVRMPGFTDFYVVRDEWHHYEAGQLARVTNVLPDELFDTRISHTESTEATISTTTETKTSEQVENSQTQSTSLSQTSTTDASLNIGVNAQVEVSGQYGPAHIDASAGVQVQAALAHSETKAFTTASENVQRSVKEVSKRILTAQTRRTMTTDSTSERHRLSNSDTNTTVGLYRWLSEVHRVQVWRYPNRLVMEFELPEPGAWLRWAMEHAPTSFFNPDPGPFRIAGATADLSALDLNGATIAQLATQWRIQGLPTPPPAQMVMSVKLLSDPSQPKNPSAAADNSLIVPDGYVATDFYAEVFGKVVGGATSGVITVTVGGSSLSQVSKASAAALVGGPVGGKVGPVNTGSVPVSVYAIDTTGFTCNVNVYCALMPETYRQWQQAAFDEVVQAYQNLRRAHQQEVDAAANKPGSLTGLVGPPDLNRARVVAELRRLVIEELMGHRFVGRPAIETTVDDEPNVEIDAAHAAAPTVQFFEQAFEWENLVYVCYPYYWARRKQWPENAISATADPQFDQFLNCGSARVVVPARPGFEHLVNYFRHTGCIWAGKDPPAPNDPAYLSVAQEIQTLQRGATDGNPVGPSWEITLPTTLLWAGDDPATLPVNPSPSIQAPPAP